MLFLRSFFLSLVCLFLFGEIMLAQDCETDYSPSDIPFLPSSPLLKDNSVMHITQWFENDLEVLEKPYLEDKKLMYRERYLYLQALLRNDYFLFEDSLQTLVDDIGARLLGANEIENAERLQFLLSRSGIPNASCRGEGTIVINSGLLLHLENSDQLAFVMAHELAHHHLDHVNQNMEEHITFLNSKETSKKIDAVRKGQEMANSELRDWLKANTLDFSKHSRNAELLTDSLGIVFYKNAGFSQAGPLAVLKTLGEVDEVSEKTKIDLKKIFHFEDYPWKEEWIESNLSGLSLVKITDEEKKLFRTHPEIEERIAQAQRLFSKESEKSESNLCTWKEQLELEILERDYEIQNLFYALMQGIRIAGADKKNNYANGLIAHCLLDLCWARKVHQFNKYVPHPNNRMREDYLQLATFLDNLSFTSLKKITRKWIEQYCKEGLEKEMADALKIKAEFMENDFGEMPNGGSAFSEKWKNSMFLSKYFIDDSNKSSKKKKKKKK